ncbi:MAG: ABC transporter permease [Bacteroidales bacterium]|nr:ABC transporter permease [Bacteroidales bacterium]
MKKFITFVKKEFLHILRDRWTTIILLLLPVVILILFGYMMTTEVKNTRFMVFDPVRNTTTRGIAERLSHSEYFIFEGYLNNPGLFDQVFRRAEAGLIVVFAEDQLQLIADGSDPNTASTLVMYATNIISGYMQEQAGAQTPNQLQAASFAPHVKLLYNPSLKGAYNFVPGVMGMILMLICAMMTSVSIAREKENGTMEILLVSPMKPLQIILSKVVPYFVISLVNLTTILLIACFIMDVPIRGSFGLLVLVSLLFIFVSLAIGLLISSIVDKQMVALLISGMVMMLPVIMLSGMLFPTENMPWFLRWLSQLIPAKWYILAIKKIMIQGVGFSSVTREVAVLGVMAVLFVTASLKSFKNRL